MDRMNPGRFVLPALVALALAISGRGAAAQSFQAFASVANTAKCMDVIGGNMTQGTGVEIWGCHGGTNQQILLQADGHLVVNGKDGRGYQMCLDYYPTRGNNGDKVTIWPCHPISNPGDNQKWTRLGSGELRSASGRCIDIQGGIGSVGRDGTPLVLWDCPDPDNYNTRRWGDPNTARALAAQYPRGGQKAAPPIVGQVGNGPAYQAFASVANTAKCMDVIGGNMTEGTGVEIWGCHGGANQQILLQADGHLAVNGKDGRGYQMCLDYYPTRGNNGDKVTIWPCHPISNPGDNQKWTRLGSGELRSASGRCIDIQGGIGSVGRDGTPLVLWDCPDPDNYNTRRWGDPNTARALAAQYPRRPATPPAAPAAPAVVRALYVLDGTDSKSIHHNSLWHLYERWNEGAQFWDGPNLMATDINAIYANAYQQVCKDVKPTAQGGKGVTQVFLIGYSRGAMEALRLANEARTNCGAHVQFLGLVDAVNTSLVNWPIQPNPGIPVMVHLRKQADWEHVLTTANILGIQTFKAPEAVGHHGMVCAEGKGLTTWKWVVDQMMAYMQQAGGSFGPPKRTSTDC